MAFINPAGPITVTTVTSSTLAPTVADSGTLYHLDRAAGIAVTLPTIAAANVGTSFRFHVKTAVTSNSTTIKVPSSAETMSGIAYVVSDNSAAVLGYVAGATADTITLNGTTLGGLVGDMIEVTALTTAIWGVRVLTSATGTEATPFSATV
jgi:hypothetical protein